MDAGYGLGKSKTEKEKQREKEREKIGFSIQLVVKCGPFLVHSSFYSSNDFGVPFALMGKSTGKLS